jgi:hypothetical protein
MPHEQPQNHFEQLPENKFFPPPTESLFEPLAEQSPWPEEIINNQKLREQVELRTTAHEKLEVIFDTIAPTNMEVTEAMESGIVNPDDATTAFDSLATLLESDPGNTRLLLYIPFEIIPEASWTSKSETLNNAIQHFKDAYITAWYNLLSYDDVRANFVDGDVLEVELRTKPLERVTKAAHLIPQLIEKKLLTIGQVTALMDDNPNTPLEKSIAETLPVLVDLNLISQEICDEILKNHPVPLGPEKETLAPEKITDARARWMKREAQNKNIDATADILASEIISGKQLPESIEMDHMLPAIHGIRKAIEQLATKDTSKARSVYDQYASFLASAYALNEPAISDALTVTFTHLVNMKIIDQTTTDTLGISIPKLDGTFKNKADTLRNETTTLESFMKNIESDSELSKYIYPATILFGSRLKGYGTHTADLDYAVFIKPGTNLDERDHIQKLIQESVGPTIDGKAVEFWLEENNECLNVRDVENPDTSMADSTWAHVLFEGAWYGNSESIKELHEKLLSGYVYSKDKKYGSRDSRSIWLEEMEKDTLQYRLLHRGYDRSYPNQGRIHTEHADLIDGKSTFYDSGYRRMATKLFLRKVFLPQLEK